MGIPDLETGGMRIVPNEDHPPMSQDVHRLRVKATVRGTGKKVRKKKKVQHRSAHPRKLK